MKADLAGVIIHVDIYIWLFLAGAQLSWKKTEYEPFESLSCFLPPFFLVPAFSFHNCSKFDSSKCKLILNYRSPPLKETVNLSNTLCRIQRWSLCLWKEGDLCIFFYKYWKEVYKVKLPHNQPTKNLLPFLLWPWECFLNVMKYIKSVNIYYCVNSLKYLLFEAALYLFLLSFESA